MDNAIKSSPSTNLNAIKSSPSANLNAIKSSPSTSLNTIKSSPSTNLNAIKSSTSAKPHANWKKTLIKKWQEENKAEMEASANKTTTVYEDVYSCGGGKIRFKMARLGLKSPYAHRSSTASVKAMCG